MRWQDMKRDELTAYAQGVTDTRRDLLIPEWSTVRYHDIPWRVGILCHVFGAWAQLDLDTKRAEDMDVGAWQAIQERLVVEAAVFQIRLLMGTERRR